MPWPPATVRWCVWKGGAKVVSKGPGEEAPVEMAGQRLVRA